VGDAGRAAGVIDSLRLVVATALPGRRPL